MRQLKMVDASRDQPVNDLNHLASKVEYRVRVSETASNIRSRDVVDLRRAGRVNTATEQEFSKVPPNRMKGKIKR